MSTTSVKHGDFTGLAGNYSNNRPDYSTSVLKALLSLIEKPVDEIDAVDVGAGTGIWSRMLATIGCRSVISVEPNDDMRNHGQQDSVDYGIEWKKGSGESTGLPPACCDLVTMASSFHWVDFRRGVEEFHRILRQGGRFVALWNPRYIEANPLLVEIENTLHEMCPDIKRVSSGRSGITATLTDKLTESEEFTDVVYLEGRHVVEMSPDRYLRIWRSVNDIRHQAGEEKFAEFLAFIEKRIEGLASIEATYLTRAWSALRT